MTTLPFLPVYLFLALRRAARRSVAGRRARARLRGAAAELRGMDARSLADLGIGASQVPAVLAAGALPAAVPAVRARNASPVAAQLAKPPACPAGCAA